MFDEMLLLNLIYEKTKENKLEWQYIREKVEFQITLKFLTKPDIFIRINEEIPKDVPLRMLIDCPALNYRATIQGFYSDSTYYRLLDLRNLLKSKFTKNIFSDCLDYLQKL